MLRVIVCCLLFSSIYLQQGECSKFEKRKMDTETCNQFIDDLLERMISEKKHKLEPYHPDNQNFTFEYKKLLMRLTANVHLHDTVVNGISSLHREGDSKVSSENGIITVIGKLAMGVIEFESEGILKMIKLSPKIKLSGEVGLVIFHIEVNHDPSTKKSSLEKFKVDTLKGDKLSISGKSIFDKLIVAPMKIAALRLFRKQIEEEIANILKDALAERIENIDFPCVEK